jgi:nijmegen breakage syndrome protein 1
MWESQARTRQTTLDPFAIDPSEFKPPPVQSLSSTTNQKTELQDSGARVPSPPARTQASFQVKETASQSSVRQTRQTRQTRQSQRISDTPIEEEDDERMSVSTTESSTRLPAPPCVVIVDRKRPAAIEGPEFDIMDMLPGAREVKRRKIAEEEERIRRGETIMEEPRESIPPTDEPAEVVKTPEQTPLKGKSKKALSEKEDSYVARAREIKQQEEEKARRAREEELAAMDGLEVEKMRNLAIVEVMEIKPRTDKPIRGVYGDDGDRWDDKWNGRKNFKKFRRQGRGGGMRTMRGSVMVNLVEHKGKDYGIGDGKFFHTVFFSLWDFAKKISQGYWVDDESNKSTRKTARETASVLVNEDSGDSDKGDTQFRPAPTNSARSTRQTQTQAHTQASSQTVSIADSPSRGIKRGASAANLGRMGVGKKQKTMFLKNESESEDESEDELKFRFKKR